MFALSQVYASIAVGIVNWGMLIGYERNYFLHEKSVKDSAALLYSVTLFILINITVLDIAVFYWREYLSNLLFEQSTHGDILVIVTIGVSLSTLANYYLTFLKNKGFAAEFVKLTLLQSLGNFLLILFFILYLDASIISLAYALLLSNTLLIIAVAVKQLKALPVLFNKNMLVDVLRISLPLTPRILFGALNTQFDKIMLGMVASVGSVGVYSIGQRVSFGVFQFMTALDRVFKPEVYRKMFSHDDETHNVEIGIYLTPFVYITVFVALLTAVLSEELFFLLFPESYSDGVGVVIILTVYFASLFFGKITGTQLIYAKKTHIITVLTIVGIVLNISLNIPMILKWGILGAAWATTIAGIAMNVMNYRVAQRYAPIQWQWKPVVLMYGTFIFAAMFSLFSFMELLLITGMSKLIIKVGFIVAYLFLGMRIQIVTRRNIRILLNNITGIMSNRDFIN